jgi:hypothetical protein
MSFTKKEDYLKARIDMLQQSFDNKDIDRAVNALEDYAISNPYYGPGMGGSSFSGWPIPELLTRVTPVNRSRVAAALMRKHRIPGPMQPSSGRALAATLKRPYSLEQMLATRMNWEPGGGWARGFTHVALHEAGDTVHIWIITKDAKAVPLEDEQGLFPSDGLVSKLRMLQQE